MKVEVNKTIKAWIDNYLIKKILQACYRIVKEKEDNIESLSVALVDNKTIKEINKQYLKINQATDVLSFDDPAQIIISWPKVVIQAKKYRHSQKKELAILLIHGLLHILGYDHEKEKEKKEMDIQAEKVLSYLKNKKIIKR